jgi:1-deoxy-D-xylulose-5-phosphate synthase
MHDVALQHLPVVFALDRAGLVGEDGPTHHGVLDLAYLGMLPGMIVMAPSDENELRRMLATALAHEQGPIALRYPRGNGLGLVDKAALLPLPIGRARPLREGRDVSLWALGSMVSRAVQAAELLAAQGVQARVVDARFAAPLDAAELSTDADRASLVVAIEEGGAVGGFGEAVAAFLRTHHEQGPAFCGLAIPREFIAHGTREELLAELGLDGPGIARRVMAALNERSLLAGREASGRRP